MWWGLVSWVCRRGHQELLACGMCPVLSPAAQLSLLQEVSWPSVVLKEDRGQEAFRRQRVSTSQL